MAKKKITVKEAINVLNTKYANTLGMLDDALDQIEHLENELAKKPKEVQVEVEKVVTVEKEILVPEEKLVTIEKEVPGPERIVEVPGPERVVIRTDDSKIKDLNQSNERLKNRIKDLEKEVNKKPEVIEKEIPVEVEKPASGDLREAARLMAQSELNKEDLTEQQIFDMLQKTSEEDVKKKIGFWAMPLPKSDTDNKDTNKRYIGKK